ncbi:hypothetical protein [Butyrivibrio sp. WCD3002]|uniref:hypothetical protein n=1 Tax=Butyrivibrio sp. WCD3002 TaxID=1280676 RepID=UPI0004095E39|nr:hypothetical protein [Butyrivibrio sp. WCD3002]
MKIMNIAVNSQNLYLSFYQKKDSNVKGKNKADGLFSKLSGDVSDEKSAVSKQMRQMIRGLKNAQFEEKTNSATSKDKLNDFLKQSGSPEAEEEEKVINSVKYNYKAVATKIQQAKTSLSAGQAVLAAKRETLKLKSKIASGQGDPEELQIALTHAKRMEMVARKKKHHIELEELVQYTRKNDEKQEEMEDAAVQIKNAMVEAEEEKLTEQEDEIFEAREEMLSDVIDSIEESGKTISEGALSDINEMISEFGEEELEQLEESMGMLEEMEIVDPHMSKEDFEELKRKHRTSEDKDIVKANMDYLKDMIEHTQIEAAPTLDIQV